MTRETKIGLLVGLAFIIVIGILLSDHLTSSTEPPQAALANAGNNVRSAVTVPGQPGPQPAPVAPPTNPAPQNTVATQNELAPAPNPVNIVRVGPGAATDTQTNSGANVSRPGDQDPHQPPQRRWQPEEVATTNSDNTASGQQPPPQQPPITSVPDSVPGTMGAVARQHGEELIQVPLDRGARSTRSPAAQSSSSSRGSEYKAQPGDSLSKMAVRFMGANTKANREAIIAANPALKDDPNKVIVGRTYMIPAAPAPSATSATPAASATPSAAPSDTAVAPQRVVSADAARNSATTVAATEYWYTVKDGDSLWRIATDQCGRPGAVAAIKELNMDVLKGDEHDMVIVGTKLRLPGKPVASAN